MKNTTENRQKATVWNPNFQKLIFATVCGSAGGIAATYGLSFLVFEETGSTLASAVMLCMRLIPSLILPLAAGPLLDRFSRKTALTLSDAVNAVLYLIMGFTLLHAEFSYTAYLLYSLLLACASSVDELAFDSIMPMTLTRGMEQKSYAVSGMIYPFLNIVMMPAAAWLMQVLGIPWLLILQGCLSAIAAIAESFLKLEQDGKHKGEGLSFRQWITDIKEAAGWLRHEKGILSFLIYSGVSNGISNGTYSIKLAFFSTTPGLSPMLFALFSGAESIGRFFGNLGQYLKELPARKKYPFSLFVMTVYAFMDGILLLLSYPFMLINRFIVGALGSTSYAVRQPAMQLYIPEAMRARVNSFQTMILYAFSTVLLLVLGWMGDWMPAPYVLICGAVTDLCALGFTWIRHRKACTHVFLEAAAQSSGKPETC